MPKISALEGKNVIFVNSGGHKKKFTMEVAKKLGVNIVLLNKKLDVNKKLVDYFIEADTYNIQECLDKLREFKAQNPHVSFDGALTFWEDDIPLLGKICEKFNLKGNPYQTAVRTRSKYEMRKRLDETGLNNIAFQLVKTSSDLKKAMKAVGFPAVMKPSWGSDSEFVVFVKNEEEAQSTFEYLVKNCNEQFNPIFKYNQGTFLYEEYIEGTEISLECFSQFGIPHVVGINEKQPIKLPYFVEYGDICPARIDKDDEAEAIKLAESCLIALGVQNSLSHIELKITPKGPKIIEIGSRMGGDDIYYNVKNVWNVDLVKVGLEIALGIKAEYHKKPATGCVICRYFIPEYSGIITNIDGIKEIQKNKNILHLSMSKNVGDAILSPPEGFDNAGWIVTKGKSYQEAETAINKIFKNVEINITRFHRDSSLGKTNRKNALSSASLVRSNILRASKIEKIRSIDADALKKLHIGIIISADDDGMSKHSLGKKIQSILNSRGYQVSIFDMNEIPNVIKKIQSANLDFVFNLCETLYNSSLLEAHAPALLDILQLPYTGSSPFTISTCLDKIKVKKMLSYHDIPTPEWDYVVQPNEEISSELSYPLIVKPANSDNSFGITNNSVVTNKKELRKQLEKVVEGYGRPALIEEYIEGDEYDVCLIGNDDDLEVLPLIRSIFDKMPKGYWHIYSSEIKQERNANLFNSIRIEKPARIPKKLDTLISEIAMDVYNIFDCHDYGKVEMRVDKNGNPFVLELNPNPTVDHNAFLPMAAKLAGYSYEDLVEEILWMAVQRYQNKPQFYHLQN
ncbi:ATP-grasp domain-containing protein [Candidatus Gracilibacteria bacterium]|nr:ATP-grasp domain-containing protein [Candidatus Gracilibacteria bacterium]